MLRINQYFVRIIEYIISLSNIVIWLRCIDLLRIIGSHWDIWKLSFGFDAGPKTSNFQCSLRQAFADDAKDLAGGFR